VLAKPIAADTGWALSSVVAGLSLGLLVAGLASPAMGRAVERRGGRPVLASSSLVFAAGLVALGLARGPTSYFVGWAVLGIGMAAGLYDAAFATLGKLYRHDARRLITNLTLIGGFASTLAWPLSALLVESLGWRATCWVYAGLHLAVGLPLHWLLVPAWRADGPAPSATSVAAPRSSREAGAAARSHIVLIWMLGTSFTLQAVITSVVAVHLLSVLQGLGQTLAAAVALGVLVGPSQVGGRLLEVAFGQRLHPVWTAVAATLFVLLGLGLLVGGSAPVLAVALVLYGAGNGIQTIVRGTLPLAVFGSTGYASLLGRLAMPILLAQAVAPTLVAPVLAGPGPKMLLWILTAVAVLNLLLACALRAAAPMRPVARGERPAAARAR